MHDGEHPCCEIAVVGKIFSSAESTHHRLLYKLSRLLFVVRQLYGIVVDGFLRLLKFADKCVVVHCRFVFVFTFSDVNTNGER